ncbi:MAG: hypothetical protein J5570_05720 [Lachnospiraceae bacterium]|nr:hypothetical protein [Lachnospiraceae bacterium]
MKKRLISIMLAGIMLLTTGCAKIQEVVDSFDKEEEPIEIEYEEEPDPIVVNMIRYDITNTYPFSEGRAWVEWKKPDDSTELGLIDYDGNVYFRTSDYFWTMDSRYFAMETGVSWIYASKAEPFKIQFVDFDGNVTGELVGNDSETYDILFRHNDRFLVKKHIVAEDRDEYYIADKTGAQVSDFTIDGSEFESDIKFEQVVEGFIEVIDGDTGRGYIDLDAEEYAFYRAPYQTVGYCFVPTSNGVWIKFNKEKLAKGTSIGFSPVAVLENFGNCTNENDFYENDCPNFPDAFTTPDGTFDAAMTKSGIIYAINEDRTSVTVYNVDGSTVKESVDIGTKIIDYEISPDNENIVFGSYLRDNNKYYVSIVTTNGERLYEPAIAGDWANTSSVTISHDFVTANDKVITPDGQVLSLAEDDLSVVPNDVFLGDKSPINFKWFVISEGFLNLKCKKGDERIPGFGKLDGSGILNMITAEAGEGDDLESGVQTGTDFEEGETTITYYDADGNVVGTETGTDQGSGDGQ